jgi:hypothetical protein
MKPERLRREFGRLSRVPVTEGLVERARVREVEPLQPSWKRRAIVVVVAIAIFAVAAGFAWSALRPSPRAGGRGAEGSHARTLPTGELLEPMTEQEQAEIFAFRSVAATGLMDPFGKRSFGFTYADDTERTTSGWRIGFAAMDCEPRQTATGLGFTCAGLSGEDPELGNPMTDTYVTVALQDGIWAVVAIEGNMLEEEQDRLLGYSLAQDQEPSHWEFPSIGVWRNEQGRTTGIDLVALWVGPFPTQAKGSLCDVHSLDAGGGDLGSVKLFYEEPPDRAFERAGWLIGTGLDNAPEQMTAAVAQCHQYTGAGWEVVSDPELVLQDGVVVGARARLEWHGDEGLTSPAVCHVEVFDDTGAVVWENSARIEASWPPPRPDDYPYHREVFIPTRADTGSADDRVSEFGCRSL